MTAREAEIFEACAKIADTYAEGYRAALEKTHPETVHAAVIDGMVGVAEQIAAKIRKLAESTK